MSSTTPRLTRSAPLPSAAQTCLQCPQQEHCLGASLSRTLAGDSTSPFPSERLAAGLPVYRCGESADSVVAIRDGALKLVFASALGGECILGFRFAGDLAGIDAPGSGGYRSSAIALCETRVCRLPRSNIERAMRESARFAAHLLSCIGAEFDHLHHRRQLDPLDAHARVADYLAYLLRRGGSTSATGGADIELPMTRHDLGNFLALTAETISRAITNLQARGLIRRSGNRIEVASLPALDAFVRTRRSQRQTPQLEADAATARTREAAADRYPPQAALP